jgi:hypothetical protein
MCKVHVIYILHTSALFIGLSITLTIRQVWFKRQIRKTRVTSECNRKPRNAGIYREWNDSPINETVME